MYLPKPSSQSYPSLLQEIEKGKLKFHNFKEILFGQFLILPN